MALSSLACYQFDVGGYAVFEGALDPSDVRSLRQAIEEHGIDRPGTGVMEQRFGWESELLAWR